MDARCENRELPNGLTDLEPRGSCRGAITQGASKRTFGLLAAAIVKRKSRGVRFARYLVAHTQAGETKPC